MRPFQTIVVAVDFSETSTDTLQAAMDLASDQPHRVHLIHVVHDVRHTLGLTEAPGIDWDEAQRTAIEEARAQLAALASASRIDPQAVTIAIAVGPAAAQIVRYADDHAADVIVLGSHDHGLVRRVVLGTVADHVLQHAGRPVMLVPHRTSQLAACRVEAATDGEPRPAVLPW